VGGNAPGRVCRARQSGAALENLKAIRADAEARRGVAHAQAATYANGGPVPQRLPVIALVGKFCQEYHQLYARWAAARAEDPIAGWDDLRPDGATVPNGAFGAGRRP
jgi:hypothetical protein